MHTVIFGDYYPAEATRIYLNAIKEGRTKKLMLDFRHTDGEHLVQLNESHIMADGGFVYSSILNPEEDLTLGKAVSSELTLRIFKGAWTINIDWEKPLSVYIGIDINGSTKYATLGTFQGGSLKKTRLNGSDIYEYTAYDIIGGYGQIIADDFVDSLTFPIYASQIIQKFREYLGVTFSNTNSLLHYNAIQINSNPFPKSCTIRDVLAWISEFMGASIISNSGYDLSFVTNSIPQAYNGSSWEDIIYTLTQDDYYEMSKATDQVLSVPAVSYIDTSDNNNNATYPTSYSGVPYKIVNNPIFNKISSANKLTVLQDLKEQRFTYGDSDQTKPIYIPMTVSAIGNWLIQVGDIIYVEDYDGNTLPMRIFSRTLTFNGGFFDSYECTGNVDRKNLSESEKEQYYYDERYVGQSSIKEITPNVNSTNWTVQSNTSMSFGDLVVVNLRVAAKKDFSTNSYLGIVLPAPYNPRSMSSTSSLVFAANHKKYNVTVLANGDMYTAEAITTNTVIVFTFSYISTSANISSFV